MTDHIRDAAQPITAEEIAELRRLHAAATPGPWAYDDGVTDGDRATGERGKHPWVTTYPGNKVICQPDGDADSDVKEHLLPSIAEMDGNGDLIVAARNSLPRLLDALEEARRELDDTTGELDDISSYSGHASAFDEDGEADPRTLPEFVRDLVEERDAAKAKLARLIEAGDAVSDFWANGGRMDFLRFAIAAAKGDTNG